MKGNHAMKRRLQVASCKPQVKADLPLLAAYSLQLAAALFMFD
ncbi:hypothetical protein [Pseudomonas sp. EA_15y_Pfl1_P102]